MRIGESSPTADPLGAPKAGSEITERHLELTSSVQSERQQLLMNESVRNFLDTFLSISAETVPPADQIHGEVLRWKGAVWARQQSLRHWRQAATGRRSKSFRRRAGQQSLESLQPIWKPPRANWPRSAVPRRRPIGPTNIGNKSRRSEQQDRTPSTRIPGSTRAADFRAPTSNGVSGSIRLHDRQNACPRARRWST